MPDIRDRIREILEYERPVTREDALPVLEHKVNAVKALIDDAHGQGIKSGLVHAMALAGVYQGDQLQRKLAWADHGNPAMSGEQITEYELGLKEGMAKACDCDDDGMCKWHRLADEYHDDGVRAAIKVAKDHADGAHFAGLSFEEKAIKRAIESMKGLLG